MCEQHDKATIQTESTADLIKALGFDVGLIFYHQLCDKINQAETLIAPLKNKSDEAKKALVSFCPHYDMEEGTDNFPGGYLDRSWTQYWRRCKFCGLKEVYKEVTGGYG